MVDLLWAVPSASLRRSVSAQGRSDRPGGTFGPARLCAPPLRWGHGGTAMPVLLTSLEPLERALRDDGYRVVAPTVRDGATFGHAAGPQSWKSFLPPPQSPLWTARRDDGGCPVGI